MVQSGFEGDLKLVHPEDRIRYDKTVREQNKHLLHQIEYRIITRSGAVRHVQELGEPVFDETGRVVRARGTLQDVTERKLVQLALEESEAILIQSAEIVKLGHAIWDYTEDKYITASE